MRMVKITASLCLVGGLAVVAACSGSPPETSTATVGDNRCSALASVELIDMRIASSEPVAAGEAAPAHCRVTGVIETEINFELLLPDDWNGNFMMGGGGGFVGTVQNQARSLYTVGGGPLHRGYATVGTDTGHAGSGIEADWALDHTERQENWGHRAVHLTAEAAKSIIRHYYDQPPEYSYFVGCSRGGGQGMMESQRYPTDFDGIVAGAPAYHWTAFTAGMVQTQQAIYPDGEHSSPVITSDTLTLLSTAIDAACDTLDGVDDGVLADPRECGFDPATLHRCADDEPGADCVTGQQLAAIKAIYDGPTSNGKPIFAGFPFGGEDDAGGWDNWITGSEATRERGAPTLHHAFGTELYKYFIFSDQEWDYTSYDFSTWKQDTAPFESMLDATDADLSAFDSAGGKMILWTGWSDPALTALGTIDYYERVESGDPNARDYLRSYMLPGVLHCGGGPGPADVDWAEAIRAWVEDDRAPERLLASKQSEAGETVITRPVCPYPQAALYDGTGDPNDESSFSCQNPS